MDFEFTGSIYVEENDLQRMCELCRDEGLTPLQAFGRVSICWDDCDYYLSDYIQDAVVKEIERRLAGE